MTNIYTMKGDITQVRVDAIMTLINSSGAWFGGVDGAIYRTAGDYYHDQVVFAAQTGPLADGNVVFAKGDRANHSGEFDSVVFVIDDLQQPLGDLVEAGMKATLIHPVRTIALPLMRTGVMLGAVEAGVREVLEQMSFGVSRFLNLHPEADLEEIVIVEYARAHSQKVLRGEWGMLPAQELFLLDS